VHIELADNYRHTAEGRVGAELISACVHCGFCLETCPTYLDRRDERDSPRGRIYLIRQLLETGEANSNTRRHLDRCLTCRSCETTCPSGMEYGRLLDLGRELVEAQVPRSLSQRSFRWLLRHTVSRPQLFGVLLRIGQMLRPLLPVSLKRQVPERQQRRPVLQTPGHTRRMLLLEGCVQAAATPTTNDAARRLLNRLGITLHSAQQAGCCGAVHYHLAARDDGRDNMRRNIDAWWPAIADGAEAIVSTASGCGALIAEYGALLADDPAYAAKAQHVSDLHRDMVQVLEAEDLSALPPATGIGKVAVHVPCSLQHALQLPTQLPDLLRRLGFDVVPGRDGHLCCGSAGTYSILEPAASQRLRERKLHSLTGSSPAVIVTANIGCQLQLGGTETPVMHWLELLDTCTAFPKASTELQAAGHPEATGSQAS